MLFLGDGLQLPIGSYTLYPNPIHGRLSTAFKNWLALSSACDLRGLLPVDSNISDHIGHQFGSDDVHTPHRLYITFTWILG